MNKFVIVGSYRTGTTLLNEALAAHPSIKVTFEALHEDCLKGNVLWRKNSNVSFCKNKDFLDYVFLNFDGFKILYHQLPTTNLLWNYFFDKKIKIIHLIRENLAEVVVSFLLCQKTGIWQNRESANCLRETIHIDPVVMKQHIEILEQKINEFSILLSSSLVINYNYMTINWNKTIESVCRFIEIDYCPLPKTINKRTNSLNCVLSNFEENQSYFKQTTYAKYF